MSVSSTLAAAAAKGGNPTTNSALTTTTPAGTQAQFLQLLTTQLKNQDPLNPMDNAQLTSQIAQINTVSGIATLNTSVQGLSSQFLQMQTLQGAALVGKGVTVPGNQLEVSDGTAEGGFKLTSAADAVTVSVINQAGAVIGTMQMGPQSAGTHGFQWPSGNYDNEAGLTFKVAATSGSADLSPTPLMHDTVDSISASGTTMQLQLKKAGSVDYSAVAAFD